MINVLKTIKYSTNYAYSSLQQAKDVKLHKSKAEVKGYNPKNVHALEIKQKNLTMVSIM